MCRFVVLCILLFAFKEAQGQTTQVAKYVILISKNRPQHLLVFFSIFALTMRICAKSISSGIRESVIAEIKKLDHDALLVCYNRPSNDRLRSNGNLPINAHVVGCIEPPCILPQLEDVVVNVVFEAPYLLDNLTTKALAIVKVGIIPIEVNYDLGSNAVTCNFLTNATCPIQEKEVVQYTLNMFIESFFPAGTEATIEFRVEDKEKVPVWCIRVPIKIAKPRVQADISVNQRVQIIEH